MSQTTILLLTANPSDTAKIRVDEEIKQIKNGLRQATLAKQFGLETEHAVETRDLRRAVQRYKPQFVHFSGHGEGQDGLVFDNGHGDSAAVNTANLANFFQLVAGQICCVVLNACYSEVQARAIAQHIDYVIGMSAAISDDAAIQFSAAFYESLANGETIESAYNFAKIDIGWQNQTEANTPQLIKRQQAAIPTAQHYQQLSDQTVFLAECSDDLAPQREQLKTHLQQQNVRVLPDDLYYFPDAEQLKTAILADLQQAKLYIQLLSNTQASRPPGMSTPLLQHQLASSTDLPRLQWQLPHSDLEDTIAEQFDTQQIIANSIEDFKPLVIKRLQQLQSQQDQPVANQDHSDSDDYHSIFIDIASEDTPLTDQIVDSLQKHDFDITTPLWDNSSALEKMQDLEANLQDNDIIILIYHQASQKWLRQQLINCRKATRKRHSRHRLIAICQDHPDTPKPIGVTMPNMEIFYCPSFQTAGCLPTLIQKIKAGQST